MWTIDKFINPAHAAKIYEKFYFIIGLEGSVLLIILAVAELVILTAFLLGLYKNFSYGFVLVLHAVSTLPSFKQYLSPFGGAASFVLCCLADAGGMHCPVSAER